MKNWLIRKLGGVLVSEYVGDIENVARAANVLIEVQDSQISKLKAGKAEMEEAGKAMSECISELVDKLNETNRTINGLRQIVNGTAISSAEKNKKIEELQAEIEAKNAELARVKSEVIAISKVKAGTALSAENQRLRAELELLKRNKFKRGRK